MVPCGGRCLSTRNARLRGNVACCSTPVGSRPFKSGPTMLPPLRLLRWATRRSGYVPKATHEPTKQSRAYTAALCTASSIPSRTRRPRFFRFRKAHFPHFTTRERRDKRRRFPGSRPETRSWQAAAIARDHHFEHRVLGVLEKRVSCLRSCFPIGFKNLQMPQTSQLSWRAKWRAITLMANMNR